MTNNNYTPGTVLRLSSLKGGTTVTVDLTVATIDGTTVWDSNDKAWSLNDFTFIRVLSQPEPKDPGTVVDLCNYWASYAVLGNDGRWYAAEETVSWPNIETYIEYEN